MSSPIHEILKHFNELQASNPNSDILAVRADLYRAFRNVPFTEEEVNILRALFLIDPQPPERDRLNHVGTTSGRPAGGTTQSLLAQLIIEGEKSQNAKNILLTRKINVICEKLAKYLGPEYGDDPQSL